MPKKLAVTIAGAVSLGSYEAGVLWEVLDAIRQHNSKAASDADKIIIDVLTGASAGGMTAIILAQKLLYNGGEFADPYDNPLYNVWVQRISLAGLQETRAGESALQSIFSSDLIETISEEALMARYAHGTPPAAQRHPAVGDNLGVGVAMTNLNGIPYGYQALPDGTFTYIDCGDQLTRKIDAVKNDNAQSWEMLRQAAVACGAFPFAFRPQAIERSTSGEDALDYDSVNLQWDGRPRTFTYSDGGILQNQPLGMAKDLVDPIDCHLQEKRFYLFVSPHAKDPKPVEFTTQDANYIQTLKRLVSLAAGQSGFEDWIKAQQVNERVRLLDDRALGLKNAILAGEIDVGSLNTTAAAILRLFFPTGQHVPPGSSVVETLENARARIEKQYAVEISALAPIAMAQAAFRDSVLAFETAAGLGGRDIMTIYGVTAKSSELAGAGLQAFLGFFDEAFRQHDYDVGRDHAQKVLARISGPDSELGLTGYEPSAIRPIDHSLDGLELDALPKEDVEPFKQGVRRRVNQMLKELHPGYGAADFLVDALIDRVIGRAMPAKPDPTLPLGRL
ncbi:MAG TPA: patatin-like phospholipase family protein [Bryobacteraceae bacterium]|jgi:predicted acylesterase/phospholipase RssA|nr:patatin-like phospholipase family protein [Bryobacteraceae bacterium]